VSTSSTRCCRPTSTRRPCGSSPTPPASSSWRPPRRHGPHRSQDHRRHLRRHGPPRWWRLLGRTPPRWTVGAYARAGWPSTSWRPVRPAAARSRWPTPSVWPARLGARRDFGTETVAPERIAGVVAELFDLRPAAIIRDLDLRRPIYRRTAAYGHFGRSDKDFTWRPPLGWTTCAGPSGSEPGRRCVAASVAEQREPDAAPWATVRWSGSCAMWPASPPLRLPRAREVARAAAGRVTGPRGPPGSPGRRVGGGLDPEPRRASPSRADRQ